MTDQYTSKWIWKVNKESTCRHENWYTWWEQQGRGRGGGFNVVLESWCYSLQILICNLPFLVLLSPFPQACVYCALLILHNQQALRHCGSFVAICNDIALFTNVLCVTERSCLRAPALEWLGALFDTYIPGSHPSIGLALVSIFTRLPLYSDVGWNLKKLVLWFLVINWTYWNLRQGNKKHTGYHEIRGHLLGQCRTLSSGNSPKSSPRVTLVDATLAMWGQNRLSLITRQGSSSGTKTSS